MKGGLFMESSWSSAHLALLSRRDFVRWWGAPLLAGLTTRLRPDILRVAAEQGPPGGCSEAWARLSSHPSLSRAASPRSGAQSDPART